MSEEVVETGPRVAVIGGGVSGLATAHFLRTNTRGHTPDVTLIEAGTRLGGKVLTQPLDGRAVDTGPDAILTRVPAMQALLEQLALADAVVAPAPTGVYLWSRGELRRLPPGTFFGVPDRLLPLLRTRLISLRGLMRAGLDIVLPRRDLPEDATVAELLRPRFGAEVLDRLVDPLVGGVHAGTAERLSAASAVPDIDALVRTNRSVYLALRRRRRQAGEAGPAGAGLVTFDGGLDRLVTALTQSLAGCELITGSPVTYLEPAGGGFRLTLGEGDAARFVDADAVVLATPAFVTAELVAQLVPTATSALRAIPYVDVATVTLAYPRSAVPGPLSATGFLVPPVEGRLLVGCTWLTAKWSHLADSKSVLIRGMVGRVGDRRWMTMGDTALVEQVHEELVAAMGLTVPPAHWLVQRWPRAIPQYTVGHRGRVELIESAFAGAPGLYVAGAAYRGAGVASCVGQAERTATDVLDHLASLTPTSGGST